MGYGNARLRRRRGRPYDQGRAAIPVAATHGVVHGHYPPTARGRHGASSGIGLELARQFAQGGFDLIVCAEDSAIHAAASALTVDGCNAIPVQADLSRPEGVEHLWERVIQDPRPLEAIAINAGVGVGGDFAFDTSLEAELKMVALNCSSSVHLAKRASHAMALKRSGRILFTSSIAAVLPAPFEAVYGATKAFLLSLSEALRNELADHGVSVTALMPGPTETNFFHRAGMDDTRVGQMDKDDPAEVARAGYEALMDGKDKVVAGSFKNKLMAVGAKLMSQEAAAAQHRKLSEPGSGTPKTP